MQVELKILPASFKIKEFARPCLSGRARASGGGMTAEAMRFWGYVGEGAILVIAMAIIAACVEAWVERRKADRYRKL